MSPLSSVRGTGGSINDTAVVQNQNTLTHPQGSTKGQVILTAGSSNWTVPDGVTKVCIVAVGAGGGGCDLDWQGTGSGGGGGLSWGNNITVKPGDSLPYSVGEGGEGSPNSLPTAGYRDGGDTWIKDSAGNYIVFAEGGEGGSTPSRGYGGEGGNPTQGSAVHGGGDGGRGNSPYPYQAPQGGQALGGGGGGAAGYDGNGGWGGYARIPVPWSGYEYNNGNPGQSSSGAGGGGTGGWGGGGVGLYGEGPTGEGGEYPSPYGGKGGSGGDNGGSWNPGAEYGGGGASGKQFMPSDTGEGKDGGDGAIRIVWGCGVTFPDDASGTYPTP